MTELTCSRAGCSQLAGFKLLWRNPKIHATDRVKVWLACIEHQQFLIDYLSTREFFIEVEQLSK